METLFENKHVRTKEVLKEFYRHYFFGRTVTIICYGILLVVLLLNIILALLGRGYSVWVMVFVPLFIGLQIFNYYRALNIAAKRDKEVGGGEISVETLVFDDHIQSTSSNGAVNKLGYGSIKSVTATKNLIFITSEARMIYILRKDGFTKGTYEAFMGFLINKGIKVK